jgi:hypothetical protein
MASTATPRAVASWLVKVDLGGCSLVGPAVFVAAFGDDGSDWRRSRGNGLLLLAPSVLERVELFGGVKWTTADGDRITIPCRDPLDD